MRTEEQKQKRRIYEAQPQRREYTRQKERQRQLKLRHPCPICGIMICGRAQHCPKHCVSLFKTGVQSAAWKGGKIISGGYVYIYKPEHPRATKTHYVLEHILVWEKIHGKPLPPGWIIHHLNGIRSDNRPANLVGLPDKKHRHLLEAKAKRIQELEALLNNQGHLL
mgnify:FL=1